MLLDNKKNLAPVLCIFFGLSTFDTLAAPTIKNISLGIGSVAEQKNIAFLADANIVEPIYFQYTNTASVIDGKFPMNAATIPSQGQPTNIGWRSHFINLHQLQNNQSYSYRIGSDTLGWSDTYQFVNRNTPSYEFIALGDPQIGSIYPDWYKDADHLIALAREHALQLEKNVSNALQQHQDTSFIISLGDQVEFALETLYSELLITNFTKTIPSVMLQAGHDDDNQEKSNSIFNWSFNQPQHAFPQYDIKNNFYFVHQDTLFVSVSYYNFDPAKDFRYFITSAVAKYPQSKWRVLLIHDTFYGCADNPWVIDKDKRYLRRHITPVIDSMGFDVVMFGHDHCYLRSKQLYLDTPQKTVSPAGKSNTVINPKGAVYITTNSSTGSKFYPMRSEVHSDYYTAVAIQNQRPSYLHVAVDANQFGLTNYELNEQGQSIAVDNYSIVKDHTRSPNFSDYDLDSIPNTLDAFPFDNKEWLDADHDGIGNNEDPDDDNDGVPDFIDAAPLNPAINWEKNLPLDNSYKGSSIAEKASLAP